MLFDVKEPCTPTKLSEFRADNVGGSMYGGPGRTIVSGANGVQKFRVGESLERVTSYQASISAFHVNLATGYVAAAIGKDIAVLSVKPSGQFVLTDRFRLPTDQVGSLFMTDTGQIYMGWNGGLGVGVNPQK